MPTRTTSLHGFTLEPARAKPVALVVPDEDTQVIGGLIHLDGRTSYTTDEEELTYTWGFVEVPLGSTVDSFLAVEAGDAAIAFAPDVTGRYTISLVVSTAYRTSEPAYAIVDITAAQLPLALRTTPDGTLMFRVISSFWQQVERNAVFSTLWSGYMQTVASDLLRAFEVDYNKSIATIQDLSQKRWLAFEPALELDSALCTGVFGYEQSGVAAFTTTASEAVPGLIINSREILLLGTPPALEAVGAALTVFTSAGTPGNVGEYTIERLNSDGSGYLVAAETPFPAPGDEVLSTSNTLVTLANSAVVYSSNVLDDYVADGVEIGDVLRLETGVDAGYYTVRGVGVPDGLANNRTLLLDRLLTTSLAATFYTILNRVRVRIPRALTATTSTVYLPATEADLSVFAGRTLAGTGSVVGAFELLVERRHVLSALVGTKIVLTSGSLSGRGYTITGVNTSGTGYLLGTAVVGLSFPATVSYSLDSGVDISDRLLTLEDEAYEIVSATYSAGTPVDEGGRGPVWAVVLRSPSVPSGRESMTWAIGATLTSTEYADLAELGVTYGDLLVLEVVRKDTGFAGTLPCRVLGAVDQRVSFDFGTSSTGLTDAEVLALAGELQVPRVYEDHQGTVQVTLVAETLQDYVLGTAFSAAYANLPLGADTVLDLAGVYQVTIRVRKLVRNCRLAIDELIVSVPSLFEYIDEPSFGTTVDGDVIVVGPYGETKTLSRAPLELLENRDYTISDNTSTRGSNLITSAGSSILRIPQGALIDRDLRVGDAILILAGVDAGIYYVRSVLDSETVHATAADNGRPSTTATGLQYQIVRRTAGRFLRLIDGLFTPDSPAPDRFWAPLSLLDNNGTIEDNFGVLVGVTKEQLDEFGSSQVSYKGAVQALMYAWTNGPTVRNVTIGTHILVGLPVTEARGRVLQIDDPYDGARGRVLVEDLGPDGAGTGLVRVYFFLSGSSGLSDFLGLAINPKTGQEYAVADVVEAFSPLSRGIIVSDYLVDPLWWRTGSSVGADELRKYHTWQVAVDAGQIDSRDVPLVRDFIEGIRPIYTKPTVVLVLYLFDEVTITDVLSIELTQFFADDPVLSIESTHMLDSYNGSSLSQRILDYGSFGTRTLFEGRDLVTTAASGTVTSARGGFMGTLSATPLPHAPDEDVGLLPGVNAYFEDSVYYRGTPLVRAGDVLFIREGPNVGRYLVDAVVSDTQLTVSQLVDYPPTSVPIAEFAAATDQVFQIQRGDDALVTSGTGATIVSTSGSGDSALTIIEDTGANFRWDGVAVGDELLVVAGADKGRYEVLQVGWWDTGVVVDRETRLTVRGTLTVTPFDYEIEREQLRQNAVWAMTDMGTTAASHFVTSATGDFLLLGDVRDMVLRVLSGASIGREIPVIDIVDDTTMALSEPLDATDSNISAEVFIRGRFESGEPRDEDWELARLMALDEPEIVVFVSRSLIVSVADLDLANDTSAPDPANWTATGTSATDLVAAGVSNLSFVDIGVAAVNSGTRKITSLTTFEVTIEGLWREDETPVAADFYDDAADWTVVDDTVTYGGTTNLEMGSVEDILAVEPAGVTFTTTSPAVTGVGTTFLSTLAIGDVVRFVGDTDADWARVAAIASDTALTLDRNYTGAGGAGGLEQGTAGGLVLTGDTLEVDGVGDFVVLQVLASVLTLTRDTGVNPAAAYTGRVVRRP